jgi:hypothetical protein
MKIIYAPNEIEPNGFLLFLAGSIEMGVAENWQDRVAAYFRDRESEITILNPRRTDWDSSWVQSKDNPQFREQVQWELEAQEVCDKILMYFDPATKSPISLLELGLFAHSNKLIVCCPKGFWRKGNVDIVCERYEIEQAVTLREACEKVRERETP